MEADQFRKSVEKSNAEKEVYKQHLERTIIKLMKEKGEMEKKMNGYKQVISQGGHELQRLQLENQILKHQLMATDAKFADSSCGNRQFYDDHTKRPPPDVY